MAEWCWAGKEELERASTCEQSTEFIWLKIWARLYCTIGEIDCHVLEGGSVRIITAVCYRIRASNSKGMISVIVNTASDVEREYGIMRGLDDIFANQRTYERGENALISRPSNPTKC